MKNLMILITLILLVSCGKNYNEYNTYPNVEEVTVEFAGIYNIGDSQLVLTEDEDGKIDITTSYIYSINPDDGTFGRFYLNAMAQRIVNDEIRYRYYVQSTQFSTYLWNIEQDSGRNLEDEAHLMDVNISFNEQDLLIVTIKLYDADGRLVVNREMAEEQ